MVEDEPKVASVMGRGLRKHGYAVDISADGVDALSMATEYDYDVIVLDLMIPGIDGVNVCTELRARGRWAPVLMLTARGGVEDRIHGLDAGADDYLVKPFAFGELLARLRALIRGRAGEKTSRAAVADIVVDPARHFRGAVDSWNLHPPALTLRGWVEPRTKQRRLRMSTRSHSTRRQGAIVRIAFLGLLVLSATSCTDVTTHPSAAGRHPPPPISRSQQRVATRVGRSVEGRTIHARDEAQLPAHRKGLVVGCIHGNECAGIPIANDLAADQVPRGVDLWVVPDLNPDGHSAGTRQNANGVDLNRNFPERWRPIGPQGTTYYAGTHPLSEPESAFAAKLILHTKPDVSIWFHQQENLVDRSGGNVGLERRYARLVGLPLRRLPRYPGSVTGWENHRFPNSTAFVVELPPGRLGAHGVETFSDAVLSLLRGRAAT